MSHGEHSWKRSTPEQVNKILRSAMQDSCKAFTEETIKPFFKEKIVNKVDIGKISYKFAWRILSTLRFKKEIGSLTKDEGKKQLKLLSYILIMYQKGVNIEEDSTWKWLWFREGLPAFSEWLENFPALGRIGGADKLEKQQKEKESEWWETQ